MKAIKDLKKKINLPSHHLQVILPPPLFLKLFIFTQRTTGQVGMSLGQTMAEQFELCDAKTDAYKDVIQLCTAGGLADEADHLAQVAHVDAPLVHGLSQGGPIHREHCVIQAVLHLQGVHRPCY